VRQDVLRPGLLVDINDLPLDPIEDPPDGGLRIERWHGPGSRPRRGRSRTGTNSLPLGSRMCRRRSSSPVPPSVSFPAKQTFELPPNIGSLSAVSYLPHLNPFTHLEKYVHCGPDHSRVLAAGASAARWRPVA
jgi:hypothetical protein